MTSGETAYLALAIAAFLSYAGLLAYGIAVASERPKPAGAANQTSEPEGVSKAA